MTTTAPQAGGSILGNPVQRLEDPRILRGEAKYFDDLAPLGTVHVVFVRSTIAHARVTGIDTSEAASMPGVVAVHTHETLGLAPVQGFIMMPPTFNRPPLADGVVRFVGDAVAVVVAETRAQAVDAAEMVIVDYDPLPVVVDPEAALEDGATVLFPEHGSNVAIEFDFGDDPEILDGSDVVVSGRFVNQRVAAVPMEANGILVEPGADDTLVLTVPTQSPSTPRRCASSRRRSVAASAPRTVCTWSSWSRLRSRSGWGVP
jgi:carbon-monoxide dehydrogenase large subunit